MAFYTTLKALRTHRACYNGYNKLVRALQGKPFNCPERRSYIRFLREGRIPLAYILESNGLDDAVWSLRACEQTPELLRALRLYAVWCARQVQQFMTDQCSVNALDVAERHANGDATDEELRNAVRAVRFAAIDAIDPIDPTAVVAVRAALVAMNATRFDPMDAAMYTTGAARDAWYAWCAMDSRAADWDAAMAAQTQKFIEMFCSEGSWN